MRIHLVFLSIMLCLGGPGCNSRASFEENNGNNTNNTNNTNNVNNQTCSNGVLDPGEACDLDIDLIPRFQAGDSCENRGFAGGDLICDSTHCQVITSNCIPAATDCSPLYDTGCDELNCYYFPENNETACADHGDGTEGTFCDSPFQCAPRHTCFENSCRKVCNPGSIVECTGNLECENLGWLGGDLGVCPLGTVGCDPLTGNGCSNAGDACYLDNVQGLGFCVPEGSGTEGHTCDNHPDCSPGYVCLKLTDPTQGYCTRLCNYDFPCILGQCAFHPGYPVGFCAEPSTTCQPDTGGGCSGDQACTVINESGTASCMLTNSIGEGGNCDMFTRCAPGLYCAVEYDKICHRVCQAQAECGGLTCHNMNWSTVNGLQGYCR